MTHVLKRCLLPLAVSALAACGPATPVFTEKLDGGNSLKVTVRTEGEGPVQLGLYASYVAKSTSCDYFPMVLFGVIEKERVPSTAYLPVPVRQVGPTEFVANVPLPVPNKCNWTVDSLKPSLSISGSKASVFNPSMSVTGRSYLPQGQLTYYCARVQSKYIEGEVVACDQNKRANANTTIHIRVEK